jgi:hypothetical protein
MDPPPWALYPWSMASLPIPIALSNGSVLVLITLAVVPIAAIAFARSGPAWRSIGKGPLAIEEPEPERKAPLEDEENLRAEVRQLVLAANERRERRGEAPLDVANETERRLADRLGS